MGNKHFRQLNSNEYQKSEVYLTHISLASLLWDITPEEMPQNAASHSGLFCLLKGISFKIERNSDSGNGSHNVSLPIILKRIKVSQMLRSSCISLLLVPIL